MTRRIMWLTTLGLPVLGLLVSLATTDAAEDAKANSAPCPNIIFLLADDLGYGDIGAYGQTKIRTPTLDRLAREGMRFTQHYSGNAVCAPSRCVLMTGLHPGHAFIRDNRAMKPEGQHPIPLETITLPKLLKQAGYATGGFGKWGLGGPGSTGEPLRQGIERFFGYNCQAVAHNFYPTYLWDNNRKHPLDNPDFAAHQKLPPDADPRDPASYARYSGKEYAPDLIAEQALKFIRDNRERPFFLYFPTTVPHLALQVPEDSLQEYAGKFEDEPYPGGKGYLPHLTPRAAYAAMVTRLDRDIGRIVNLVHDLGLDDNTLFVFTSDNGPLYDRLGGTDTDFFQSARELRGRKGSLYEGGVRVPCVVRWTGKIPAGKTSDRVTGFEDWLPTLLDLAGIGTQMPKDIDGISFAATLLNQSQAERPFLYREFPGYTSGQFVRVGNWKLIRPLLKRNPELHELYDLAADPSESKNVAADHPDVLAKLRPLLASNHTPSEVFPLPGIDTPPAGKKAAGKK